MSVVEISPPGIHGPKGGRDQEPTRILPHNEFHSFLQAKAPLVDRYTSLASELRHEEKGWKNSSTFEDLVAESVLLSVRPFTSSRQVEIGRETARMREYWTAQIFGKTLKSRGSDRDRIADELALRNPALSQHGREFVAKIKDFSESFQVAIGDIEGEYYAAGEQVLADLGTYLRGSYHNLEEFREFLEFTHFKGERERIRPVLVDFSRVVSPSQKDPRAEVLDGAVRLHIEEGRNNRTADNELFVDFVGNVLESGDQDADWLRWGASLTTPNAGEVSGEDVRAKILKLCAESSDQWPTAFEERYNKYVAHRVSVTSKAIRHGLEVFDREAKIPLVFDMEDVSKQVKKKQKQGRVTPPKGANKGEEKTTPAAQEKPWYPVGVIQQIGNRLKLGLLDEDQIDEIIVKKANKTADGDERLQGDFKAMIKSLREDPYGLGTEVLKDQKVVIDNKSFRLRSFNYAKRTRRSELDHPESQRFRVVYALAEQDEQSVIILAGIYHHEEFDSVYGGR